MRCSMISQSSQSTPSARRCRIPSEWEGLLSNAAADPLNDGHGREAERLQSGKSPMSAVGASWPKAEWPGLGRERAKLPLTTLPRTGSRYRTARLN